MRRRKKKDHRGGPRVAGPGRKMGRPPKGERILHEKVPEGVYSACKSFISNMLENYKKSKEKV